MDKTQSDLYFFNCFLIFSIFSRNLCDSVTQIELFNCTKIMLLSQLAASSWREFMEHHEWCGGMQVLRLLY